MPDPWDTSLLLHEYDQGEPINGTRDSTGVGNPIRVGNGTGLRDLIFMRLANLGDGDVTASLMNGEDLVYEAKLPQKSGDLVALRGIFRFDAATDLTLELDADQPVHYFMVSVPFRRGEV